MARLISVPDWLYDELVILKKNMIKKSDKRVSLSGAYELRYQKLRSRYNELEQKCSRVNQQ